MKDVHFQLNELFSTPVAEAPRRVAELKPVNGVEAANKAVAECAEDSSMIFLTKAEYEDLLFRSVLAELKTYKKKMIIVVSNEVKDLVA